MASLPQIAAYFPLCFLLTGCAYPSADLPEQTTTREHALEHFKVPRDSLYIFLPVEIEGRGYPFILDTGSCITIYDIGLRSYLGESIGSTTFSTPIKDICATAYSPRAAKLGGFNLQELSSVLCLDLGAIRDICGENVYGILGMDFLGRQVFRIDFDYGEVTFLRSAGSDSGVRIPLTFRENNIPQVLVTLPGLIERECFRVDTGLAAISPLDGLLHAEVFDSLSRRNILKLADQMRIVSPSGSEIVRRGRIEEIGLEQIHFKNLLFSRSSKVSSLGIYFWSRYVVTFDFPNGAIYLRSKNKQKGEENKMGQRK